MDPLHLTSADKTGDQELASEGPTQEDGSGFATLARRSAAVLAQAPRPSPRPAGAAAVAQRVAAPAADGAAANDAPPPPPQAGAAPALRPAAPPAAVGPADASVMNPALIPGIAPPTAPRARGRPPGRDNGAPRAGVVNRRRIPARSGGPLVSSARTGIPRAAPDSAAVQWDRADTVRERGTGTAQTIGGCPGSLRRTKTAAAS